MTDGNNGTDTGNEYSIDFEVDDVTEDGVFQDETAPEDGNSEENPDGGESFFKKFFKAKKPEKLYYVREVCSYILILIVAVVAGLFINIYFMRLTRVNGNSMYSSLKNGQLLATSRMPVIFNDIHRGDIIVFDHTMEARTFAKDFKEALTDNAITALFKKSASSEAHTYYIKRVIGEKGDVIKIYKGALYRTTLKNLGIEEYIEVHREYCKNTSDINLKMKEEQFKYLVENAVPSEETGWELLNKDSEPYIYENIDYKTLDKDNTTCWLVGDREFFVMGDNRGHSTDSRTIGKISLDCIIGRVLGKH